METLSKCLIETNCVFVEWNFKKIDYAFKNLVSLAENLPRTTILEDSDTYWHGVIRSLIFRFPDDLEILKIPSRGSIQVKSASRIGVSDLGVNESRVNKLYAQLVNRNIS